MGEREAICEVWRDDIQQNNMDNMKNGFMDGVRSLEQDKI